MAITIISSDDVRLGNNGVLSFGVVSLKAMNGKTIRYRLEQLTYLKYLGSSTSHKPVMPSLTATAQTVGTVAVSAGFLAGGSVTGGVMTALMGHSLIQKTKQTSPNKTTKITHQFQVCFDGVVSAILEMDEKEYQIFAKELPRFALV